MKTCKICGFIGENDFFKYKNGTNTIVGELCISCKTKYKNYNSFAKSKLEEGYYFCQTCKTFKKLDSSNFDKSKYTKTGYVSTCRLCRHEIYKSLDERKKNQLKLSMQNYQRKNQEQIRNKKHEYYLKTKEQKTIKDKLYIEKNKLKININKKVLLANKRADKYNCFGKINKHQLLELYNNSNHKCYYCSKELDYSFGIDHKTPLSKKGNNTIDNIVISCNYCNCKKRVKNLEEFEEYIKKERIVKDLMKNGMTRKQIKQITNYDSNFIYSIFKNSLRT